VTAPERHVWATRRKWPDGPHYEVLTTVLGEDEHGTWLGAPVGTRVILPDRSEREGQFPVVSCVPRDEWWFAQFWFEHPEVDIYVDICTPARWVDDRVIVVDLDFDVIQWNAAKGGHVSLVDEDEFEQHRVELAYPDELQADARRSAADVVTRMERGEPPFNVACATPWLAQLLAG
jgi:protein associated with RNAse G/E